MNTLFCVNEDRRRVPNIRSELFEISAGHEKVHFSPDTTKDLFDFQVVRKTVRFGSFRKTRRSFQKGF